MSEIAIRSYRIHMQFNDLKIIDGFCKRNGSFCQTNFFQKNITFTVLVSWKIDEFRTNIIFFREAEMKNYSKFALCPKTLLFNNCYNIEFYVNNYFLYFFLKKFKEN